MSKSIYTKLSILILIPCSALFLSSVFYLFQEYKIYKTHSRNHSNIPSVIAAYDLLSLMQIERGMSSSFLSGSNNQDKLQSHYKKVDQTYIKFTSSLSDSYISEEVKDSILKSISESIQLRPKVQSRNAERKNVLSIYTQAIRNLMNIKQVLQKNLDDKLISDYLTDLYILEEAKESGGKLRANMSSFIARNKGLSLDEFNLILKLKAGLDVNINSNSIRLNKVESKLIKKYHDSQDTHFVENSFNTILEKAFEGSFNIDSLEFFDRITKSLKMIDELVHLKHNSLSQMSQQNITSSQEKILVILCALLVMLSIIFSMTYSQFSKLGKEFNHILSQLVMDIKNISGSFNEVVKSSKTLSHSTNKQVENVQSISSGMHELKETLEQNTVITDEASEISHENLSVVSKGRTVILQMSDSIQNIDGANSKMSETFTLLNQELNKINSVINEISDKTSVINDIVFQTKLLSFNASVEAARAGEVGKGFAVVAQEIGNLANMSGTASEEINQLIQSSHQIVLEVSHRVEKEMSEILTLRAYPKTSACLNAIIAKAKWHKAS